MSCVLSGCAFGNTEGFGITLTQGAGRCCASLWHTCGGPCGQRASRSPLCGGLVFSRGNDALDLTGSAAHDGSRRVVASPCPPETPHARSCGAGCGGQALLLRQTRCPCPPLGERSWGRSCVPSDLHPPLGESSWGRVCGLFCPQPPLRREVAGCVVRGNVASALCAPSRDSEQLQLPLGCVRGACGVVGSWGLKMHKSIVAVSSLTVCVCWGGRACERPDGRADVRAVVRAAECGRRR